MKVALVSAVFGNSDLKKTVPEQTVPFDRHYFTEQNSPYPLSSLNDRLKAKFFKTQFHKVIPGYDFYIWIDGSVQIDSPRFVETMIAQIGNNDFAFRKHTFRNCIYKEASFIESGIRKGNPYITDRYAGAAIQEEVNHYKSLGFPEQAGLFEGGVFIVRSSHTTFNIFNHWWEKCLLWSYYDQFSLRVLLDGANVSTLNVDNLFHLVNHGTVDQLSNVDISIVIPTYEQGGKGHIVLRQLLDSIRGQRCKYNYEVVVSDNSKDKKVENLVMKYDDFFDLNYIRNTTTYGVSNNSNNAIEHAKYSVVKPMFMDDKFTDEEALNTFCEQIKTHGWVASDSWHITGKKKIRARADFDHKVMSHYNPVGMPSVIMFRKNGLRFDPNLKTMLDVYFYHQLYHEFGEPAIIRKPLVGQRFWKNQVSAIQENYAFKELQYLKGNGKDLNPKLKFVDRIPDEEFSKLLLQ